MINHFSAIGFPVGDREDLEELAALAANKGRAVPVQQGYYIQFSLSGGPELWVQANANRQIIGCHPHFAGSAVMDVRIDQSLPSARSAFDGGVAATVLQGSSPVCELQCAIPDFAAAERNLVPGIQMGLQVGAFAEGLQYFKDEDTFRANTADAQLAVEALIGSGSLTPGSESDGGMNPRAVVSGRILKAEQRSNPLTGIKYQYLAIKSLTDIVDIVADPAVTRSGEPLVGGIVVASVWLSGRLCRVP